MRRPKKRERKSDHQSGYEPQTSQSVVLGHTAPLLLALLCLAAGLRLWNVDFGLPGKYRPDEEFLVSRGLGILGGELNPHFFQYPSLQLYLLAGVYGVIRFLGWAFGWFGGQPFQAYVDAAQVAPAYLWARCTTAIIGTLGVYATFRLGRALYGSVTALAAAALLALNFCHARESHFATADVPMTLWATLALTTMVLLVKGGRRSASLLAGALCGLAFSTKYPGLALCVPLALAHCLAPAPLGRSIWTRLGWAAASFATLGIAFLAGSPYVLLDWKGFTDALRMEASFSGGLPGLETSHGLAWLFGFAFRYGAGLWMIALALVGAAGTLLTAVLRRNLRDPALLLLAFAVAYLTPFTLTGLPYLRYVTPVMPLAAVLAAHAMVGLVTLLPRWRLATLAILLCATCFDPAARLLSTLRLFGETDTRNLAREWIARNAPPGARIAADTYFFYPKPELAPGYGYVDFKQIAPYGPEAQPELALVDEHSIAFFSRLSDEGRQLIESRGQLAAEFDPFTPGARVTPVFEPVDAFYVPVAGHAGVRRPGPRLKLYRLTPPPTQ